MFHQDITPHDYEFFRTHSGAFKRMWQEQVMIFLIHLLFSLFLIFSLPPSLLSSLSFLPPLPFLPPSPPFLLSVLSSHPLLPLSLIVFPFLLQTRRFWSVFLSTFDHFIWNYGAMKDFPIKACSSFLCCSHHFVNLSCVQIMMLVLLAPWGSELYKKWLVVCCTCI